MKRTLIMVRHAKSSWADALQSDFDRPLNDRGKTDAPEMGVRLKKKELIPDLIISSPAKRAKQTAKKIADEVGYDSESIKWVEKLYHCIPSVFDEVISGIGKDVQTVYIVAHNPGITDFVNRQSENFRIDNMPTCGIAGIELSTDDWSNFSIEKRKVFLFDYPGGHDNTK